jgi:hypothetical protein
MLWVALALLWSDYEAKLPIFPLSIPPSPTLPAMFFNQESL